MVLFRYTTVRSPDHVSKRTVAISKDCRSVIGICGQNPVHDPASVLVAQSNDGLIEAEKTSNYLPRLRLGHRLLF